jgi:folylpolyglutamate synthase/dihydrofolate synthase
VFNNVSEAIYWIENKKRKDKRKDLTRMKNLLAILNNPQNSYKIIHIAGTNGKGATCNYITNILIHHNFNVGRFISPYILKFNERIEVNGISILDQELLDITNYIYPIIIKYEEEHDDLVMFFELLTIIGLLYFKIKNVDYAVVECGLGGLLDATNAIDSKLQVIPSVGYDHMNVLGNTLEEIALHKLGIVKDKDLKCIEDGNKQFNIGQKKITYIKFKRWASTNRIEKIENDISKIGYKKLDITPLIVAKIFYNIKDFERATKYIQDVTDINDFDEKIKLLKKMNKYEVAIDIIMKEKKIEKEEYLNGIIKEKPELRNVIDNYGKK